MIQVSFAEYDVAKILCALVLTHTNSSDSHVHVVQTLLPHSVLRLNYKERNDNKTSRTTDRRWKSDRGPSGIGLSERDSGGRSASRRSSNRSDQPIPPRLDRRCPFGITASRIRLGSRLIQFPALSPVPLRLNLDRCRARRYHSLNYAIAHN